MRRMPIRPLCPLPRITRAIFMVWLFFILSVTSLVVIVRAADNPPSVLVFRTDVLNPSADYSSMVLDSSDFPHIAYDNYTSLSVAHWNGSQWLTERLPITLTSGDLEIAVDVLALDSQSHLHMIYDTCNMFYCTAWYAKQSGSQWLSETIAPGSFASLGIDDLVLDANDRPHISYRQQQFVASTSLFNQGYAYRTATGWVTSTIQSSPIIFSASALELDNAGVPQVTYMNGHALIYATWSGSHWVTQTVDSTLTGNGSISLALNKNDQPYIAYSYDDGPKVYLKYAVRTGQQWTVQTVDTNISPATPSSFAIYPTTLKLDSQGYAHIGYVTVGSIRYARWTGSDWLIYSLERLPTNDSGYEPISLALDKSDLPRLSYSFSTPLKFLWGELPQHQFYLPMIQP